MPSKISSFNRGLFTQSFRSVGWIGLVYSFLLLFALPLQLLMKYTGNPEFKPEKIKTLFELFDGLQLVFMFTVPVLLAVFLFRYIQTKAAADYFHSLPVRREALYHQNIIVGIAILVVPVVITAGIIGLVKGMLNVTDLYTAKDIMVWAGYTIIFNLVVFFGTVAFGMFTGISILQAIFLYVLFLLPGGFVMLLLSNLKFYWYGFPIDYYLNKSAEKLIPFLHATELMTKKNLTISPWIYVILIIIFYAIGYIAYKKRHIEAATQSISFKWVKPIFVYGVTTCALLVGGVYFGSMQGTFGWMVFGYVLGALIGYIVAQVILHKTWRIAKYWKGYVISLAIFFAIGAFVHIDAFGYESKVPALNEVESVYFEEGTYLLTEDPTSEQYTEYGNEYVPPYYYTSQEAVEAIHRLHEQLAKNPVSMTSKDIQGDDGRTAAIAYKLKNGKTLVREYELNFKAYHPLYKKIAETKEFKENFNPFLRSGDMSDVTNVQITSDGQISKQASIRNPEDIKALAEILKTSMKNETFEEMYSERGPWAYIDFNMGQGKNKQHVTWEKSYDEVSDWLKKKGLYNKVRVLPEDIEKIVVLKNPHQHEIDFYADEEFPSLVESEKTIEVKNNDQKEEILETVSWASNGAYLVGIYYKEDPSTPEIQEFTEETVPDFIKEKLLK
ncbi:DUF6449 domain-containing protein [Priestia flexa]|uniref:DUF6449 domain-containing protein n=1 Tax=Priestia flexa TaxID=86664 RepID=UPI001F4CA1F9|nr:DUF6449 domain-containing protein [Priestia flexa]